MVRVVGEYLCAAFGTYNELSGIKAKEGFWIMKEYGVKESWIRIVISHDPFDLIYTEQCTVTAEILNSFPRTPENEPEPAKPSSWSSDAVQLASDIQGERQNSSVNLYFFGSANLNFSGSSKS
ncbi:hypothetical protein EZV62_005273 [Acer yangbiense]|uniref:Uncharacterized protein n=1 Tax=Acer yangbiense TaxID=1000413 RepID=A0A5C7IMM0_9ROSI|nr:hypothetical protein EZV62_005273 [Acer yangbiense]